MFGFILAFLCAVSRSFEEVFSKKSMKHLDQYVILWTTSIVILIVLGAVLAWIGMPVIGEKFWITLFFSVILNMSASLLFIRALKVSDLSVAAPLVALTPMFMLITSPLIVGEFPSAFGLIGVIFIVAGSYVLKIDKKKKGYFAPFQALYQDVGARLMIFVAFIWSLTAVIDKVGVQQSSPMAWSVAVYAGIAIILSFIAIPRMMKNTVKVGENAGSLLLVGIFAAVTIALNMIALTYILAIYVIAIKRLSILFSVIWGKLFFNEKNIGQRLTGSAIMVTGVILIALAL